MNYLKYFFLLMSMASFAQKLTIDQANHLASLPIKCLQQEYPNKLGQMLLDSTEIQAQKNCIQPFTGVLIGILLFTGIGVWFIY